MRLGDLDSRPLAAVLVLFIGVEVAAFSVISQPAAMIVFGLLAGTVVAATLIGSLTGGLATAAVASVINAGASAAATVAALDPGHGASSALLAAPSTWTPGVIGAVLLFATAALARALARSLGPPSTMPADADGEGDPGVWFAPLPSGQEPAASAVDAVRAAEVVARHTSLGKPAAVALIGLDRPPSTFLSGQLEDLMVGLRELAWGTLRKDDMLLDHGPAELLVVLPDSDAASAKIVLARIQDRAAAQLGTVRAALMMADLKGLPAAAEELEVALDVCRTTGLTFADPKKLLAV